MITYTDWLIDYLGRDGCRVQLKRWFTRGSHTQACCLIQVDLGIGRAEKHLIVIGSKVR